jgi:hypothetical protein
MANVNIEYADSTSIVCTLAGLASGSARESNAIDNTVNKFTDYLCQVKAKTSGAVSGDAAVYVYVAASENGIDWTDNATGVDAALTINAPNGFRLACTIPCRASATVIGRPFSIAHLFGGHMPRKFSIIVQNASGIALSAVEADHSKTQTGITYVVQ